MEVKPEIMIQVAYVVCVLYFANSFNDVGECFCAEDVVDAYLGKILVSSNDLIKTTAFFEIRSIKEVPKIVNLER